MAALEDVEAAAAPVVEAEDAVDAVPEPEDGATEESCIEEIGSPEVSHALVYSAIHSNPRWLGPEGKKVKGNEYTHGQQCFALGLGVMSARFHRRRRDSLRSPQSAVRRYRCRGMTGPGMSIRDHPKQRAWFQISR